MTETQYAYMKVKKPPVIDKPKQETPKTDTVEEVKEKKEKPKEDQMNRKQRK